MLPQEPRESYTWDDSCFNDWIKSSPDVSTFLHTDDSLSSRRIRISNLLSSPTPTRSTTTSPGYNAMISNTTDRILPSLVRSPRSSDLVGLYRRTSSSTIGEGYNKCNVQSDGGGSLKWEQRDVKGKEKAKDISTSEGFAKCYPEDWEGLWKNKEMQARCLDTCKNNYDDRDFDMNYTDEYRRAKTRDDDMFLASPSQDYVGPRGSPTWGRGREGTSSSDYNYDNMAIEELMKDMEVYSDTDNEQTEDVSHLSRMLFGPSCSPGIGSSNSFGLTADGKRKASYSDLDEPNFKKRHIENPLRGERFMSSANPLLHGKRMGSPCAEERHFKKRHVLNGERGVSMAYRVHDAQHMMYSCD
ncbi:hypothetical protein ONS96_010892 [Cadophora gregata f. sp. sojae]|nr:hypothetical protein ONS96_010892 [Cadophora gregata f. sp. sojae]